MGDLGEGRAPRYRAFISYSHVDGRFGRGLHRRLERYALPRRLAGRVTARGEVPGRVAPIFRDREELSASGDLTAEVRAALARSECLIVVCSPDAAASPWVAREVELFRSLHSDRPILAALAAGAPPEAFPDCLRVPGADGVAVEPLAADFRPEGDGARLALLKLVAGIVGVELDELIQRDAQRRLRAVTAITGVALAAMLAMGALTIFALTSRTEARKQRTEAEALVEFMLTDLRRPLKEVGRLDILTTVNTRALAYYGDQDLAHLPPDSLERRARLLHAMGEDDLKRGDLDGALGKFAEAARTTGALLAAEPDNADRIWAHAQSQYWLGYVDYLRGRPAPAARAWRTYRALAGQLVDQAPENPKYLREAAYAEGNLCTLALSPPPDAARALRACGEGLRLMRAAAARMTPGWEIAADLANRHAWLADAYRANRDEAAARAERLAESALLTPLIAADPKNMSLRERWIASQRALASIEYRADRIPEAQDRLRQAIAAIDAMIALDPANRDWAQQRVRLQENLELVSKPKQREASRNAH